MKSFRTHTAQSYPRKKLTRRELYVALERPGRTYKSIGESIGVKAQRVRQIYGKAIRKLQHSPDENKAYLWILEALIVRER